MYCIEYIKLNNEQIEELISVFLPDTIIKILVNKDDKLVFITQDYSLRFMVSYLLIDKYYHLHIDERIFYLLVKDLRDYELAMILKHMDLDDSLRKILLSLLNLPSTLTYDELRKLSKNIPTLLNKGSALPHNETEIFGRLYEIFDNFYIMWFSEF